MLAAHARPTPPKRTDRREGRRWEIYPGGPSVSVLRLAIENLRARGAV